MSTPGSAPSEREVARAPVTTYGPPGDSPPPRSGRPARPAIIRWKGLIPFGLLVALLGVVWLLFGDRIVETTTEEASTEFLGAHVELEGVRIDETKASISLRALRVADPLDPMRNLLETGGVLVQLDPVPLLEKKLVIRQLTLDDVRFGTARSTPAPPAPPDGFAAQTLREVRSWTEKLRKPVSAFTPIDTIRSVVLDPSQLGTVQSALALRAEADSMQRGVREGFEGLRLRETLDSAQATVRRLEGASLRTLGLDGARRAVEDIRRTIAEIEAAKRRVESLETSVRAGVTMLGDGVRNLDAARRADYEFARGLLQLPSFEGPDLGNALFGEVSLDRVEQAMYWATMAEKYMPPGLRPRQNKGPERARSSGTTVHFPKERTYPSFHLQRGDVGFRIGDGDDANRYTLAVANVSSAPELIGVPVRFVARQIAGASGMARLELSGTIDHTSATIRDSLRASAVGIALPSFDLPGLPFRVEPGEGTTSLSFVREGDRIAARWSMRGDQVRWRRDSTAFDSSNRLQVLLARVLEGLNDLEVVATLDGTLSEPSFQVRSNLDRALSDRLKAVAGEELARAEAKVRAEVDRIVAERVEPVKAHVAQVQAEATQRVDEAKARLDEEKRKLEERMRALSGGIIRP